MRKEGREYREGMIEGEKVGVGCDEGVIKGESRKDRMFRLVVGFFNGVCWR